MNVFIKNKEILFITTCLLAIIILNPFSISLAKSSEKNIDYKNIISIITNNVDTQIENSDIPYDYYIDLISRELMSHPDIKRSSRILQFITVEFSDGYQLVILEPKISEKRPIDYNNYIEKSKNKNTASALLLHPFAQIYGTRQCRIIRRILALKNIESIYVDNYRVNLNFIEQNLSSDIIYMNTHAGYWEINQSIQTQAVVIATGEQWTNNTPSEYHFEYQNKFIVEGLVGKTSYIAFTPALIDYYYNDSTFMDSFIYMATCHASYDDSMASIFLEKGASAYLSWTGDTVFWTNSLASIWTFRLLSLGISIERICDIIGNGGLYNWLFDSRLSFFGNGNYTLI
jgi:hypothetical protein